MMRRVAIIASCFVGASGVKLPGDQHPVAHAAAKAEAPTLSMHKMTTEVNTNALSPKARAKLSQYKNPAMASVFESRSRQYMQRWIQALMRPISKGLQLGKGLPQPLAAMIPTTIMTMTMNHRGALPVQEKILFDDLVALKPPSFDGHHNLTLREALTHIDEYVKTFALAYEEAGMNDLSEAFSQTHNTTSLILDTQLPSKVVGYVNRSSPATFLKSAMLEDAAAIFDERGWTSGAHMIRENAVPFASRIEQFEQSLVAFGKPKTIGDYLPNMPSTIEAFFNILESNPSWEDFMTPEIENKSMHLIMGSLTLISNVAKAHMNMSNIDGRPLALADELDKLVSPLKQSGSAFNDAADTISMMSLAIREVAGSVNDLKKLNTVSNADRALVFRKLATRGEKYKLLPLASWLRDTAGIIESNTADVEHLVPPLAKLMNEVQVGNHMGNVTEFTHSFDLFAKIVCTLDGLKEKMPICAK